MCAQPDRPPCHTHHPSPHMDSPPPPPPPPPHTHTRTHTPPPPKKKEHAHTQTHTHHPQVRELSNARGVYEQLMEMLSRLASLGLVHCDYNEFNLLVSSRGVRAGCCSVVLAGQQGFIFRCCL